MTRYHKKIKGGTDNTDTTTNNIFVQYALFFINLFSVPFSNSSNKLYLFTITFILMAFIVLAVRFGPNNKILSSKIWNIIGIVILITGAILAFILSFTHLYPSKSVIDT